jgi:hypothetical protein
MVKDLGLAADGVKVAQNTDNELGFRGVGLVAAFDLVVLVGVVLHIGFCCEM